MIDEFHKVDDGTTLWSNDKNYGSLSNPVDGSF